MNLNDFVVIPNNKAKSSKLNVRNVQELHAETATLAQESKAMEERLQLLRECMSREKEERGCSGGYRWRSVQAASATNNSTVGGNKRNKENTLHKQLSAGKVKITVLKDEPVAAPRVPPHHPLPPSLDVLTSRKPRLRGKICGQCEVRTAGLLCAECSEDYCVGCFARFHQKGALKLHRMIPIQTEMQTHVSTLDVVSRFQKQVNTDIHSDPCRSPKKGPNLNYIHDQNKDTNSRNISVSTVHSNCQPGPTCKATVDVVRGGEWSQEEGRGLGPKVIQHLTEHSQVLVVQHRTEEEEGGEEEGSTASLLGGEYDEEESARCFQEAVWEWRGGRTEGGQRTDTARGVTMVSVSVAGTQADLCSGGGERLAVRVDFSENSLTYMDRLLLKKHRRTPVEGYRPSSALASALGSAMHSEDKKANNSLTGYGSCIPLPYPIDAPAPVAEKVPTFYTYTEEEDFCRYYASLFASPASSGRAEPERHTPGPCLSIKVLDERVGDFDGALFAEQTTEDATFPSIQHVSNKGSEKSLRADSTNDGSPNLSPADPTTPSSEPLKSQGCTKEVHASKPRTLQLQRSMKSSSSKAKPSPQPAGEPLRTSKTSVTSRSLKPEESTSKPPASKHDRRSPQFPMTATLSPSQAEKPHPPPVSPLSFSPRFSALSPARGRTSQSKGSSSAPSDLSVTLRSTFTLLPPSSARPAASTKVPQSPPSSKASESVLLSRRSQSPHSHWQSPSSPEHAQSQLSMESLKQSQCSVRDPGSPLSSRKQLKPLFPPTLSPAALLNSPRTKRCTSSPPSSVRDSAHHPVSPKVSAKSILEPVLRPPTTRPVSSGSPQTSSVSKRPSRCVSAPPAENMVRFSKSRPCSGYESTALHQEVLSLGSARPHHTTMTHSPESSMEMEDGLFIHMTDGETSSESLHLTGCEEDTSDDDLEQDRRNVPIPTSGNSVPVDSRMALDEDEVALLSEPSMAGSVLAQKTASGSSRHCGLDGFLTKGLNLRSVHSTSPEHSSQTHTTRNSVTPTTTVSCRPISSLRSGPEEQPHLAAMVMDSYSRPIGIQTHSATGRGDSLLGTSVPRTSTPALSRPGSSDPLPPYFSPSSSSLSLAPSPLPSLCSSGSGLPATGSAVAFRPVSRAAQEIPDICGVDDLGCGDPDLDAEADSHTLDCLEQELQALANDTRTQTTVYTATEDSGTTGQHRSPALTWGGLSEEQKEEEEEVRRDRQSVLSLP